MSAGAAALRLHVCRKKQQEMLDTEQAKVEEMEKAVHEQEVQVRHSSSARGQGRQAVRCTMHQGTLHKRAWWWWWWWLQLQMVGGW